MKLYSESEEFLTLVKEFETHGKLLSTESNMVNGTNDGIEKYYPALPPELWYNEHDNSVWMVGPYVNGKYIHVNMPLKKFISKQLDNPISWRSWTNFN